MNVSISLLKLFASAIIVLFLPMAVDAFSVRLPPANNATATNITSTKPEHQAAPDVRLGGFGSFESDMSGSPEGGYFGSVGGAAGKSMEECNSSKKSVGSLNWDPTEFAEVAELIIKVLFGWTYLLAVLVNFFTLCGGDIRRLIISIGNALLLAAASL